MATPIDDELSRIGAALAAAGDGEPVALTDEQREVLARAPLLETLDTIVDHLIIGAALAVAGGGKPIELTDKLREVLACESRHETLRASVNHLIDLEVDVDLDVFDVYDDKVANALGIPLAGLLSEQTLTADKVEQLNTIAGVLSEELYQALANAATIGRITNAADNDDQIHSLSTIIDEEDRLDRSERDALLDLIASLQASSDAMAPHSASCPAYVERIAVEGFRGIGPRAELKLDPNPGLTLVHGANGSAKSSFVEALEVLLTGTTGRFADRGQEWTEDWPNVHSAGRGAIETQFIWPTPKQKAANLSFTWALPDESAMAREGSVKPMLAKLGWSDALLAEYKPTLGYAELGPLFDEIDRQSLGHSVGSFDTQLARHIRLRGGITDQSLRLLMSALHGRPWHGQPFRDEIYRWYLVACAVAWRVTSRLDESVFYPVNSDNGAAPRDWTHHSNENEEQRSDTSHRTPSGGVASALFRTARGAVESVLRLSKLPISAAGRLVHESYGIMFLSRTAARRGRRGWHNTAEIAENMMRSTLLMETFPMLSSRSRVYLTMLIDTINHFRLKQFSERVAEVWGMILPGDAVQFNELSLRHLFHSAADPRLRASLNLSIGTVGGLERGVLSQGQMHMLGLSIFLPAMSRTTSPFGFAVIDDPVQALDENAVAGLAKALAKYAVELQLIVFTHDDRLIKALRMLEIDHTLINVTRSKESVVQCEVIDDPVRQRLTDARQEAKRPASHDKIGRRQDVGDQCRRAIEAACIRTVRARLTREGEDLTPRDVEDEIDRALQNSFTSTRLLLALAIFGDTDQDKVGDVGKFVSKSDDWGRWVDRTIRRVNGLAHASDEETARAVYAGDLHKLIDDVERLTQTIEANCG